MGKFGLEVLQKEQDGGCLSLGVTGSMIEQQCRTDFCASKYTRDSFNLTTSVESGFLLDTLSGSSRGEGLALAVGGGREIGTGCCSGSERRGEQFGLEVLQKEQDGGRLSLGVTGSMIEQHCRTDVCASKYTRDSFNLTTSVESGFLLDKLSGSSRGEGLALAVAGGREV